MKKAYLRPVSTASRTGIGAAIIVRMPSCCRRLQHVCQHSQILPKGCQALHARNTVKLSMPTDAWLFTG